MSGGVWLTLTREGSRLVITRAYITRLIQTVTNVLVASACKWSRNNYSPGSGQLFKQLNCDWFLHGFCQKDWCLSKYNMWTVLSEPVKKINLNVEHSVWCLQLYSKHLKDAHMRRLKEQFHLREYHQGEGVVCNGHWESPSPHECTQSPRYAWSKCT